jgi:hypothetical protein
VTIKPPAFFWLTSTLRTLCHTNFDRGRHGLDIQPRVLEPISLTVEKFKYLNDFSALMNEYTQDGRNNRLLSLT